MVSLTHYTDFLTFTREYDPAPVFQYVTPYALRRSIEATRVEKIYLAVTEFTQGQEMWLYARMKITLGSTNAGMFIYAGDTVLSKFIMFGPTQSGVATSWYLDAIPYGGSYSGGATNMSLNTWYWFAAHVTATEINTYLSSSIPRPKTADMTLLGTHAVASPLTINQIGIKAMSGKTETGYRDWYVDDMYTIADDGNPISNTVLTSANGIDLVDVECRKTVGSAGETLNLKVADIDFTLLPTIITAANTGITIYDTVYYNKLFQGTIGTYEVMGGLMECRGLMDKLSRVNANYNPVLKSGIVERVYLDTIYHSVDTFPSAVDKLIVFKKNGGKNILAFPTSRAFVYGTDCPGGVSPGDNAYGAADYVSERGGEANLYYQTRDIKSIAESTRGWYIALSAKTYQYMGVLQFSVYKQAQVVEYIDLSIALRSNPKRNKPNVTIRIWNYLSSAWDSVVTLTPDNTPGLDSQGFDNEAGYVQGKLISYSIRIDQDLMGVAIPNYMDPAAANSYGYSLNTIKIGVMKYWHVAIDYLSIDLGLDSNMDYEIGVGKILSQTASSLTLYPPSSLSWLDEYNYKEGLAPGDSYYITDKLSDIWTGIMTNSGMDAIMTSNFTITDEIPEIEDMTEETILSVIQRWSELTNTAYWFSYSSALATVLPTFNFTDTFIHVTDMNATEITLDETIILDYKNASSLKYDFGYEKNSIRVVGKDGISYSLTITPDDTPTLGSEGLIKRNNNWKTLRQLKLAATRLEILHKHPVITFQCIIDLDEVYELVGTDLSLLDVGKYINLKLPLATGAIANFTSTNSAPMFVKQITFPRNAKGGYRNIVYLLLERRYTS